MEESFWELLPTSPAVYCFEDKNKKPLYVGKTIHLRTRIRQHVKTSLESHRHEVFVGETKHLRFYPIVSELETILLEASLIRLLAPKYNAIAKDDRSYLYIKISKDEFPKVSLVRKSDLKSSDNFYGPFTSATQATVVLKMARRMFKYCQNPLGKRACFYYHLNLCSGACVGNVSKLEYRKMIGQLKRFLGGQTIYLLEKWRKEIKQLAKSKKFEEAAQIETRYKILYSATQVQSRLGGVMATPPQVETNLKSLRSMLNSLGIETTLERIEAYDNATMAQTDTVGAMVTFLLGVAQKSDYRYFKIAVDSKGDTGAMSEVLRRRFKHSEWPWPDLVIVDGGKGQLSAALEVLPAGISVIGLAKRLETVVYMKDGKFAEYVVPEGRARKMLQMIRDEVHRFVNTFLARRRRKLLLE